MHKVIPLGAARRRHRRAKTGRLSGRLPRAMGDAGLGNDRRTAHLCLPRVMGGCESGRARLPNGAAPSRIVLLREVGARIRNRFVYLGSSNFTTCGFVLRTGDSTLPFQIEALTSQAEGSVRSGTARLPHPQIAHDAREAPHRLRSGPAPSMIRLQVRACAAVCQGHAPACRSDFAFMQKHATTSKKYALR